MPASALPLVDVPGGTIQLRDARAGTSRKVTLRPFQLGRTAVTWAQYGALVTDVVAGNVNVPAHGVTWFGAAQWCNAASADAGLTPAYEVRGRNVAWDASSDGFRLPTEAEWEWSCRAGTAGPTYGPLAEIAWTAADKVAGPQPVGR